MNCTFEYIEGLSRCELSRISIFSACDFQLPSYNKKIFIPNLIKYPQFNPLCKKFKMSWIHAHDKTDKDTWRRKTCSFQTIDLGTILLFFMRLCAHWRYSTWILLKLIFNLQIYLFCPLAKNVLHLYKGNKEF